MDKDEVLKKLDHEAARAPKGLDIRHTKAGIQILPTFKNAKFYLQNDAVLKNILRYNLFSSNAEIVNKPPWGILGSYPKPIDDMDILDFKSYLIRTYEVEFQKGILNEAIDNVASENSYDPVMAYLEGLKWDGIKRLDTWLTDFMGVESTPYTDYISRMSLTAACARVQQPGIKYDYMLILEGVQDIGKSLAVKILGGAWYRELSLIERTKETVERMQGAWIIEVPELAVFKKRDIESLKAFITCDSDSERLPYGRRSKVFPRRNIFIGTINPDQSGYLSDNTGNRRFLPVECSRINIQKLQQARDQLWAEAWQSWIKKECQLYLPEHIKALAVQQQCQREIVDEWIGVIENYVRTKHKCTTLDIWTEGLKGFSQDLDRVKQMRIADCMRRLGWKRSTVRTDDGNVRGYINPEYYDPSQPWRDITDELQPPQDVY